MNNKTTNWTEVIEGCGVDFANRFVDRQETRRDFESTCTAARKAVRMLGSDTTRARLSASLSRRGQRCAS